MLTVDDIFKRLAYGHLSNLAMSTETLGQIRLNDQNKIINHLNTALTRLYTRFNLRESELILLQYSYITNYHMDKRFAHFNPDRSAKHEPYILDLPEEPFDDDVIKILRVNDLTGGNLPLNNEANAWSLYTPYPTTLQVPNPVENTPIGVQYQANHKRLQWGVKEAEVIIPSTLEDAVLSMVAYLVYSNMNTQESIGVSQGHMAMYEAICTEVEATGNVATHGPATMHKFEIRGWA